MKFSEKIRQLRIKAGLTQKQLADAIGVAENTVVRYEAAKTYPRTRERYGDLARVLDVDVSYLLVEDDVFLTAVLENYGDDAAEEARRLVNAASALFSGGKLTQENQLAFVHEIQTLYFDSIKRARTHRRAVAEGNDQPKRGS